MHDALPSLLQVQEEKAHEVVETNLEKRFLEVGALLENEVRRRLKHTKMSEAVHATVQATLESVCGICDNLLSAFPPFHGAATIVQLVGQ